ncbi:hypothetical protein [Hymenobacter guriensis]|uniref:Uncharacterized protein n=1 Tax=Hymenobacter guriensis TaxID=2793065 RepID=A0ABS0L3Z0_9BACT|nr:hypothetical protein [Hymenobacter guriensis]MBG8554855.1 hypothetical protein [Hymenobacter guriensis]
MFIRLSLCAGYYLPASLLSWKAYQHQLTLVLCTIGCLLTNPAKGQMRAYVRTAPDTVLIRQALELCQDFNEPAWETLAAALRTKPGPVSSYLNMRAVYNKLYGGYSVPIPVTRGGGYTRPRRRHVRQLTRHLNELNLERRQGDYARLSNILLEKASKVRQIRKAIPVLEFEVDGDGRVQDVWVDEQQSKMGLTKRSRKIILNALHDEDFQVRESHSRFSKPRPFREWRQRTGRHAGHTIYKLFGWIAYKKVKRRGRCGEIFYTEEPRIRVRSHH